MRRRRHDCLLTMIPAFAPLAVAKPKGKGSPIRGKASPIKKKEKETKEEGDRTVADHQGQKEVSPPEALRPPVIGSRPLTTQRRVVSSCGGSG